MSEKGKNLVYLYVKLSILSIEGARLIFINTAKCPTKSLIKMWDVVSLSVYCSIRESWRILSSDLEIFEFFYNFFLLFYVTF